MPHPLSFWTADQFSSVIGQLTALVIGITGLLAGIVALRRTARIEKKTDESSMKADNAVKSSDAANERAGNNAQAINDVRRTLDQVTLQTPPTSPVTPVEFPSGSAGR